MGSSAEGNFPSDEEFNTHTHTVKNPEISAMTAQRFDSGIKTIQNFRRGLFFKATSGAKNQRTDLFQPGFTRVAVFLPRRRRRRRETD